MPAELILGRDAEISRWVADRIDNVRGSDFGPAKAIGVASHGRLIAGVVYHEYQPDFQNAQLSMAAENPMWARRDTIAALLHYPFVQLNCWMIFTLTPPENAAALRVNQHIGFERKTIVPHAFGKRRHAVVCQMLRPTYQRLYEV